MPLSRLQHESILALPHHCCALQRERNQALPGERLLEPEVIPLSLNLKM